ncbi:MAG: folate-binding protein YgfZ [Elusimicrobia bacterium]|nr:folate-binding protein YgfZ [Elusimicrobiota bacterium]
MIRVAPADAAAARDGFLFAPVAVGALVIAGPDRHAFLHGLLTADVKALAKGAWTPAYYLTPKGRLVAQLALYDRGEDLLAVARPEHAAALERGLARPVILTQSRLEPLRDSPFWAAAGPMAPPGGLECSLFGPCRLYPAEPPTGTGRRVDAAVLEALRIRAGVAAPQDLDEEAFPLELGSEAGISFDKGCYLGQETTAKMKNLGHPNRRLCRLELEDEALDGAELLLGGERVGRVTSAARLGTDGPIGLALLKRHAASAGTRLSSPGGGAAIVAA